MGVGVVVVKGGGRGAAGVGSGGCGGCGGGGAAAVMVRRLGELVE